MDKPTVKWILTIGLAIAAVAVIWLKPIRLGLDLSGGTRLVLEAQHKDGHPVDSDAVEGVLGVIRNRVDSLGVAEPLISRKGNRQIVVELPGVQDPDRAIRLIGDTAQLAFVEAEWAPENAASLPPEQLALLAGPDATLDKVVIRNSEGKVVSERPIILKKTWLTGSDLAEASPGQSQLGEPVVNIRFTPEGAVKFKDVTTRCVGRPLAILLDGSIISAPNVNEPIVGGQAQISGQFSIAQVRDLVIQLKAGALPVPVVIVSNKVVGPTLGKDSIAKSRTAGLIGFVAVVIFMVVLYRVPGIMASLALGLYTLLFFSALKLIGATLTLPGIAGFILSIGMAVDANVIIFERIKEERRQGMHLLSAIDAGFDRAFYTIVDSNVTTLISTLVLFFLGTGSIKGFAVTLSIGIVISMFTAITVSRLLVTLASRQSRASHRVSSREVTS